MAELMRVGDNNKTTSTSVEFGHFSSSDDMPSPVVFNWILYLFGPMAGVLLV